MLSCTSCIVRPASPTRRAPSPTWADEAPISVLISDDLADARGARVDLVHALHDAAHRRSAAVGHGAGLGDQRTRRRRVLGVALHRFGQLLHRTRGLLQRAGLALGAVGQVDVAAGDLARGLADAAGGQAHLHHHRAQLLAHAVEFGAQPGDLVAAGRFDLRLQVAGGDARDAVHRRLDGDADAGADRPAGERRRHRAEARQRRDQQVRRGRQQGFDGQHGEQREAEREADRHALHQADAANPFHGGLRRHRGRYCMPCDRRAAGPV
nr:hypothetical protein [Rubrivivax gelatinosus]